MSQKVKHDSCCDLKFQFSNCFKQVQKCGNKRKNKKIKFRTFVQSFKSKSTNLSIKVQKYYLKTI